MKIIFEIDPKQDKTIQVLEQNGIFTIYNSDGKIVFSYIARSGGWGNGPLPEGDYKLVWYDDRTEDSYTLFNIGWLVSLVPQFKTTRTNIAIHPDGNVEGSLGCIVIPFKNLDDNIRCRNILRDIVDAGGCLLTAKKKEVGFS